ncbi:MAG: hypothetical protein FWD13_09735 [Treponema sp.]|nr:hypothetical protein [Treponema sp.]
MKNLIFKMVFSFVVLMVLFSFLSCVITPQPRSALVFSDTPSSGFILMAKDGHVMQVNIVPMKDFNVLGIIFVESSATVDSDGNIIEGSRITYEMLMREAQKLNADDIINLKIDEIHNIIITEEVKIVPTREFDGAGGYRTVDRERVVQVVTRTIDYKANALAIKYTNAVTNIGINYPEYLSNPQDINANTNTDTSTSSNSIIPSWLIPPGR